MNHTTNRQDDFSLPQLTREKLEQLSKGQLIDLVLVLYEQNKLLQERCHQLEEQNKALVHRVEELERKLGMNSSNSSKPPSSDPPEAKARRPQKNKSKRKRGGQPGHKGHYRELVPVDQVDVIHQVNPCTCDKCGSKHLKVNSSNPWRHQIVDLPAIKGVIEEWQMSVGECLDCGAKTRAKLPDGVPQGAFGIRLQATISVLSGRFRMSKREIEEFLYDVFHTKISLGSVCGVEASVSEASAEPVEEVHQEIQKAEVAHADETGWKEGNKRAWLWVLATTTLVVFMIHLSRGKNAAKKLLGEFSGTLGSDRWTAYNDHQGKRQLCWAHLLRDAIGFSEYEGKAGEIGDQLVRRIEKMFKWWHKVRDGIWSREQFSKKMVKLRIEIEDLLIEGELCSNARMSRSCKRILKAAPHLWTFVEVENVEPTNNFAERIIRRAVLWRRGSFGTQSEDGSRFVERILTVISTCRLQGRNTIEFLHDAISAKLQGRRAPSLLVQTKQPA